MTKERSSQSVKSMGHCIYVSGLFSRLESGDESDNNNITSKQKIESRPNRIRLVSQFETPTRIKRKK